MKNDFITGSVTSKMENPLSLSNLYNNSSLVSNFSSSKIIAKYSEVYKIDVSKYFEGVPEVQLRRENTTGYQFFYPFNLGGDASFYKYLQNISWYYADWKWEFDIALNLIEEGKKVLEIGCGKGAFLKRLKEKCECIGLELNDEAEMKDYNVTILNQTIEAFALNSSEKFDWVAAFQVLEHIADIESFITSSLKVLKKEGRLLIAVPNNQSAFFNSVNLDFENQEYLKALLLNMPPHHMGKWNAKTFNNIQQIFDIELIDHVNQKVQPWRKELNKVIFLSKRNRISKFFFRKLLANDIGYNLLSMISSKYAVGDCILVVFKKK